MAVSNSFAAKVEQLHGPILVLGASGFVGANLFRQLLAVRTDVYGTASKLPAWRLEDCPEENVVQTDLRVLKNVDDLLEKLRPATIFNLTSYGAYSFETEFSRVYATNTLLPAYLLEKATQQRFSALIHAGTSSEYGENSAAPTETDRLQPNSHYAISKVATAHLIALYAKKGIPCVNLRLYSIYGPYEDSSRLIPNVLLHALDKTYPPFVNPDISRDFVYVDDACEAFVDAALAIPTGIAGKSYNIGSGQKTTIRDIAETTKTTFAIEADPEFGTMDARRWDMPDWYSDPALAAEDLGWKTTTSLADGLRKTYDWLGEMSSSERDRYRGLSKKFGVNTEWSVSAIVACYKDGQAIPYMYQRVRETFEKMNIDFELILVNDCSPDNSEDVIREISAQDPRVIGISHSRNFGSQAAFRSGMEIATKNACVLMDGDLQDPPELIEEFIAKWQDGYDVVYGRRVQREAPWFMQIAYKAFYRVFDSVSSINIPRDAGDFSLMDKTVVAHLLTFPERDLFVRGIRAYAGFKQTGVDYVRPERMFGVSTNNLAKNIEWAKKGILSFSNTPLKWLSTAGFFLFALSMLAIVWQIFFRIFFPTATPPGVTTTLLLIVFFGSINLLGIGIVGEYIAKILEETKARPHFIRRKFIRNGQLYDSGIVKPRSE